MRKIFLVLVLFLLSGCLTNKDFDTICKQNIKTTHLDNDITYEIIYDADDVVKKAIVTRSYKALDNDGKNIVDDMKKNINDFNKKYSGSGIKYYTEKSDDKFVIMYDVPVSSVSDDLLNEFKLNKNSIKLFNGFKKESIECEG